MKSTKINKRNHFKSLFNHNFNDQGPDHTTVNEQLNNNVVNRCIYYAKLNIKPYKAIVILLQTASV